LGVVGFEFGDVEPLGAAAAEYVWELFFSDEPQDVASIQGPLEPPRFAQAECSAIGIYLQHFHTER
jgi:hypothetical protein